VGVMAYWLLQANPANFSHREQRTSRSATRGTDQGQIVAGVRSEGYRSFVNSIFLCRQGTSSYLKPVSAYRHETPGWSAMASRVGCTQLRRAAIRSAAEGLAPPLESSEPHGARGLRLRSARGGQHLP